LKAQWEKAHNHSGGYRELPLWTYFDLATAHQWLYLQEPTHVWETVDWFWTHQSAPGFFTWWEGNGEENAFGRWKEVRGWVAPKNVTPHYWTASEMLALQLDMLVYLDQSAQEPVVILGAGVKPEWLAFAMSVKSVPTEAGLVDWSWRNHQLHVVLHGSRLAVRTGLGFGPNVAVSVEYAKGN
jgi:hypothetical protein